MYHLPEDYAEKVYSGWLGKCIGVRFGAPIENWTYRQISEYLGEVRDYLPIPEGKVFQPDDDTSVPMILLRAVEDYGVGVKAGEIGKTLLNYLGDQHGSLWWGGYGISTEHTAYLNLKSGILPPLSGSIAMNGATVAEQIGGQIFSDIWGLLVPNDPHKAAEYAREASSVTHDGNGVYGGMFVAAMVSAAFACSDPVKMIQQALEVIPEGSEYARMVHAVMGFHSANPADWRACCQFIQTNFGYDRYPGIVHIIPNAAIMMMGMLYGGGDFSQTIEITNMGGWDTDCNVGNVGAVMGVAVGLAGIPDRWRLPINDMFVAASMIGSDNILDIPCVARRIVSVGEMIAGRPVSSVNPPRYDFTYPGATHGFRFSGQQRNILTVQQMELDGQGVLKGVVRLLKKKQEMMLYVDTYFHPQQLNSSYYGAGFSPKIYPGQTMQARLFLPVDGPETILASLFVHDSQHNEDHRGQSIRLIPGQWQTLRWTIPAMQDACFSQAGISFRNLGAETWKGLFFLDYLDWSGQPCFSQVFPNLRKENDAAEQWTYLRGYWRLEADGYHGSGTEISETYTGELAWRDLEIRLKMKPLVGDLHGLSFRVGGALRSYCAAFTRGKLSLLKKEDGVFRELASAPLDWEHGQSYWLEVQVSGNEFSLRVNQVHLRWRDDDQPYENGQIGLMTGLGCNTCFEELSIR